MEKVFKCSFCGLSSEAVDFMIEGPSNTNICNECITLCSELLAEHKEEQKTIAEINDCLNNAAHDLVKDL